jgi:hypothetical protein
MDVATDYSAKRLTPMGSPSSVFGDVACRRSPALWTRIRKASWARAPKSPMPGEGRSPNGPARRKREIRVTEAGEQSWQIGAFQLPRRQGMSSQSPLKAKPLRLPGESVDKEIDQWVTDKALGAFFVAASLCAIAYFEWHGFLTHSPRRPILFTVLAAVAVIFAAWRFWTVRARVRKLRLGRDGERVVGQFLERLREGGGQVFHDIPGDGFNLDHVVISTHGIYAVETKTWSKPWPNACVVVDGGTLTVAGQVPDRNPIVQASSAARWLEKQLQESTGKRFLVRGVVVFPGWFVEQKGASGDVWVLEPKMLPGYIRQAPEMIAASDVALASFHLSRYVRSEAEKAA